MLIDCGTAHDPWTAGRRLGEAPEIDPSAVVRNSEFGRYTYLGPRSHVANSELGDYGYAMGGNQIAHAVIGKFCNLATGVRINPSNHPCGGPPCTTSPTARPRTASASPTMTASSNGGPRTR